MTQFLLIDSLPDLRFPPRSIGYWSTFQTGLEFANGARKPSFAAYRLPIWGPDTDDRARQAGARLGHAEARGLR